LGEISGPEDDESEFDAGSISLGKIDERLGSWVQGSMVDEN
jgi:hypothetical protein